MPRKDKPTKRVSLKDHLAKKGVQEEAPSAEAPQMMSNHFSKEDNEKLIKYNETVTNLDEKYTSLEPISDVLVRVFVNPLKEKDGVLQPNTIPVNIPTKAGVGDVALFENQFPYSQKAIVVAVPEGYEKLKEGDIVGLSHNPVTAKPIGRGDNAMIIVQSRFVHPDEVSNYPPEQPLPIDPTDPNYGYLLVKPYDIQIKL